MLGVNQIFIKGFLGKPPEVRFIGSGEKSRAVASFSVATTEKWKNAKGEVQERTDWHEVSVWGRPGERCGEFLRKGSQVLVIGRLQYDSYESTKHPGVKMRSARVVADQVHFLDRGTRPAPTDPGQPVRGGDAAPTDAWGGDDGPPPPNDDDAPNW